MHRSCLRFFTRSLICSFVEQTLVKGLMCARSHTRPQDGSEGESRAPCLLAVTTSCTVELFRFFQVQWGHGARELWLIGTLMD